jgi:hypothetical protein
MSSVAPLSQTVFSSPIKEEAKDGVREEDTAVLFQRMKAMVEDIKRRKSLASPTKANAEDEADFWGTGSQQQAEIPVDEDAEKGDDLYADEIPNQLASSNDEDMEVVPDSDDEAEEAEVERQTTPVRELPPHHRRMPPKTPRLDGVRDMFADPKPGPSTPAFGGMKQMFAQPETLKTPAYTGIRDMFKGDVDKAPKTPKMDGLRSMFTLREELSTPAMDGVGEMLATPAGYRSRAANVPDDVEDEEDQPEEIKRDAAVVRKRKMVSRTGAASPEPQAATGPGRVLRNPKASTQPSKVCSSRRT